MRRHSLVPEIQLQPPLKISELTHSRQKSLSNQYKTQAPAKSLSKLPFSLASSSLTLREEELNESRSSNTTWRTNTKQSKVVQTMKRFHLFNKSGQGAVSVPANSKEAQFFASVEPLIKGAVFEVEMQSRQFCSKKVYLSLNLMELHVGHSETLLLSKLLKTELTGQTLDLIK